MKITICIGSSCHIKGSRQVIEEMQALIEKNNLTYKIEPSGTFCMGNCQKGVCINLDDRLFSITPETTERFFQDEVLKYFV